MAAKKKARKKTTAKKANPLAALKAKLSEIKAKTADVKAETKESIKRSDAIAKSLAGTPAATAAKKPATKKRRKKRAAKKK